MHGRFALLIHPLYLFSLFLLLLNDHVLKATYPSVLTGKLSDAAGLFVVGVLGVVMLRNVHSSKRKQMLALAAVGLLFVAWKLSPINQLLAWINGILGTMWFSRTLDITDLAALPALAGSYFFVQNARPWVFHTYRRIKRAGIAFVLLVSGLAVIATPRPPHSDLEAPANVALDASKSYARTLFEAEQVLVERGVTVNLRTFSDTMIRLEGTFNTKHSSLWKKTFPDRKHLKASIELDFVEDSLSTVRLAAIRMTTGGWGKEARLQQVVDWLTQSLGGEPKS